MPFAIPRSLVLLSPVLLVASCALSSSACCKSTSPDAHHDAGAPTTPTATTPATTTPTATATATTKPTKNPSIHLTLGVPKDADPSDDYLLVRKQYALSYNKNLNDPNWVSWNTDAGSFGDAPRFKGGFMPDEELPAGMYRVRHDDYTNSGFDRGHMVRSEERTKNDDDNKSTFFTTNILPQYHDMNAGPWLRLEDYVQKLAQRDKKELFIVAGGIFDKKPPTIGKGVAVPKSCFKIVTVLDRGGSLADVNDKTRVIAVIVPNEKGIISNDWGQYRTTVDKIEEATGYDFSPDVPEAIQKVLESKIDTGATNLTASLRLGHRRAERHLELELALVARDLFALELLLDAGLRVVGELRVAFGLEGDGADLTRVFEVDRDRNDTRHRCWVFAEIGLDALREHVALPDALEELVHALLVVSIERRRCGRLVRPEVGNDVPWCRASGCRRACRGSARRRRGRGRCCCRRGRRAGGRLGCRRCGRRRGWGRSRLVVV